MITNINNEQTIKTNCFDVSSDPAYDVKDIRKFLKVGRDRAYEIINDTKLPTFFANKKSKRVLRSDLINYLKKQAA